MTGIYGVPAGSKPQQYCVQLRNDDLAANSLACSCVRRKCTADEKRGTMRMYFRAEHCRAEH